MEKFRSFCFTDFILDKDFLKKFYENEGIKYLKYGEETCPTTKKIHYQGWFYCNNQRTLKSMIKKLKPRHVEICKGTQEQNEKYVMKDGIITEFGVQPEQGKRTDMEILKDHIIKGEPIIKIFEEQPGNYIRYHRGIEKAQALYQKKRDWQMDVRIYWGEPNTGKTRSVYDEFGSNVYQKMVGKWWDGYEGETCVLIDDFDPENCFDTTFDFYLKLLDRYPLRVETKGGSTQFRSKVIIITSNFGPNNWFKGKKNRSAFFRRVNQTIKFGSPNGSEVSEGNTETSDTDSMGTLEQNDLD